MKEHKEGYFPNAGFTIIVGGKRAASANVDILLLGDNHHYSCG